MADKYLETKIRDVQAWPKRPGKADLLKYLHGERITRAQAINGKCYECEGGEGGDCTIRECLLLPFSPFGPETGDQADAKSSNGLPGS